MRLQLGNILHTFEKTATKLEKFVTQCNDDVSIEKVKLNESQRRITDVENEKSTAMKSLDKIKDILGKG
jgi:hypothetical protein